MLNLIKTSIFRAILAKIVNFGLVSHIHLSDAKTHTFIPFGAYNFVYLNNIDFSNSIKITGKIISCV